MILTNILMKVLPEKRKELLQALSSLVESIRKEKGCKSCNFYCSSENENEICLLGEWETKADVDAHLQSNLFRVLLGAMSLLKDSHEIKFYTEASRLESPDRAEAPGIS
ncbi:MAG: antibiotic biosynthesis monooxygenase [Deltaproteobacteria bacterium]|nr:antibiotic biosynthesis monooxygenase [Deltaproteobacteria bacterium]